MKFSHAALTPRARCVFTAFVAIFRVGSIIYPGKLRMPDWEIASRVAASPRKVRVSKRNGSHDTVKKLESLEIEPGRTEETLKGGLESRSE